MVDEGVEEGVAELDAAEGLDAEVLFEQLELGQSGLRADVLQLVLIVCVEIFNLIDKSLVHTMDGILAQ